MTSHLLSLVDKSLGTLLRSGRGRKRRRPPTRRSLAFESLETRELLTVVSLQDLSISTNTGEKPQSKVWEHAGQWWTVMPNSTGTWVSRLDGTSWTPTLKLSTGTGAHADVKVDGDVTHVLLFNGSSSQLASIEYVDGPTDTYRMWAARPGLVSINHGSLETATIDIDSTGRMWLAGESSGKVNVWYSDGVYSSWSAPVTIASGLSSDDIAVVTAMPNDTIGVLWSNQSSSRFGFRVHVDGVGPSEWLAAEVPASQSAAGAMADDHLNVAVGSDGTLYAAVKTSYDSSGRPKIALLVRRPWGAWDSLYQVDTSGTRPIVLLNELQRRLIVAYTSSDSGGNILYRETSIDNISFGPRQTLISGSLNNATSTKQSFTDEVVILAGGGSKAKGVLFSFEPIVVVNQPPVVSAGLDQTVDFGVAVALDGTVSDDGRPGPVAVTWTKVAGLGTVTLANAAAADTAASFSQAGTYVLQLSANDGALQSFDTVTITVRPPAPVNQAPVVNAGPDQTSGAPAVALNGTVTDDGLPTASVTTSWTKVSGPGAVTFGNPATASTMASFSQAGTYVLRLAANDGSLQSSDTVTITVPGTPVNLPPAVSAGLDQAIQLPAAATLNGAVADDGLPTGGVTATWTVVSGPGSVTFGNASATSTTASFSQAGTYVLRLTASDGQLQSSDDVSVTVELAPAAVDSAITTYGQRTSLRSGRRR